MCRCAAPPSPAAALPCPLRLNRLRADAADAMRTASRRVAEAEARAAALSGDVDALTAELGERPTGQDAA